MEEEKVLIKNEKKTCGCVGRENKYVGGEQN